jgi:hypothetical protein
MESDVSDGCQPLLMQRLGPFMEKVEHQITVAALSRLDAEEFNRRDAESRTRFEAAP